MTSFSAVRLGIEEPTQISRNVL